MLSVLDRVKKCGLAVRLAIVLAIVLAPADFNSPVAAAETGNSKERHHRLDGTKYDIKDQGGLPLGRINYWIDKRKGDEARRLIDSVKETPANADVIHIWRGLSYRGDREPELAAAEFDKVKDFRPGNAWYSYIAGSYGQTEQYTKALKVLDLAISEKPDHGGYYEHKALYLCALGKFAAAVPLYEKAAKLEPTEAKKALCAGGEILRRAGKTKEAIALLDGGLSTPEHATDGKFWLCRAECFAGLNKWEDAAKNCGEALRLARTGIRKGKNSETIVLTHVLVLRAKCYDHLGKRALAEADRAEFNKISNETADEIMDLKKYSQ